MAAPVTPSFRRVIQNFRAVGLRQAWRDLQYIGDTKAGRFVGADEHGNRYYENLTETLWRHRWVDFASHDFNASQVTPEWHSWISHIRELPPNIDPTVAGARQPWQTPHFENLSGTPGAYKPYNTTKPKFASWEPTVAARK